MKKLTTIILIFFAIGVNAQNRLEKHKKFFNEQKVEYGKWIKTTNISQICNVKDIAMKGLNIKRNKTTKLASKKDSVSHIRRELSKFIIDYYKDKGSFWYDAYVDTSRTFYNKFIYRITCLTDEIITDGYYEYIQFKAEILIQDNAIEVRYDILEKYASGILCPHQRQQFYKSMETYYSDELEDYREDMHNRIETFLKGY